MAGLKNSRYGIGMKYWLKKSAIACVFGAIAVMPAFANGNYHEITEPVIKLPNQNALGKGTFNPEENSFTAHLREYDRRMLIIEALETSKNDRELQRLIAEDAHYERLASYNSVLIRVTCALKDAELTRKLVDLPVLDKETDAYKNAIESVFSYIAANKQDIDPEIINLLFEGIKDDQLRKDRTLKRLFFAAVSHGADHPNTDLARLLVENGADLEEAFAHPMLDLQMQKNTIEHRIDELEAFKEEVLAPN